MVVSAFLQLHVFREPATLGKFGEIGIVESGPTDNFLVCQSGKVISVFDPEQMNVGYEFPFRCRVIHLSQFSAGLVKRHCHSSSPVKTVSVAYIRNPVAPPAIGIGVSNPTDPLLMRERCEARTAICWLKDGMLFDLPP